MEMIACRILKEEEFSRSMWPDWVHCEEAGEDDTGKAMKFWTMMRGEANKNDQVQQV